MRTYQQTHQWINFAPIDINTFPSRVWLLLGEVRSKFDHLSNTPLSPDFVKYLRTVYLAKGALATTAIEGNTLTEQQVLDRIGGTLHLPPSQEYLGQEIDNVVDACNEIGGQRRDPQVGRLQVEDICRYNALVLRDLPLEEHVQPGEIRTYGVHVGNYDGAPCEDCLYLLGQYCDWLNIGVGNSLPDEPTVQCVLKAIIAHLYLAWIHPFGDGNGRTARLVEFRLLLACDVPSVAAHLLSNHYNKTRSEYYRQLSIASRSPYGMVSFIEYALQGLVDELREQIKFVHGSQWQIHWINFVHESFKDGSRKIDRRRRHLALDLSDIRHIEGVPIKEIRRISPRIAEDYANLDDKTISRDIGVLVEMGLVIVEKRIVKVNRGLLMSLLLD